jgi:hypothetical protein
MKFMMSFRFVILSTAIAPWATWSGFWKPQGGVKGRHSPVEWHTEDPPGRICRESEDSQGEKFAIFRKDAPESSWSSTNGPEVGSAAAPVSVTKSSSPFVPLLFPLPLPLPLPYGTLLLEESGS